MLMSDLIKKIHDKLSEYDFEIYNHYPADEKEYVFMVQDMLLFVHENENELNVSFQATTRPDTVASNILILNEIDESFEINVMDSFIFGMDRKFISGDAAFDLIEQSIKNKGVKEYIEYKTMQETLQNAKCFNC